MRASLRKAIEALLETLESHTFGRVSTTEDNLINLKKAYEEHLENRTETGKRIDFLQECLDDGMSKREAARLLAERDPRVSRKTAETLVYLNFSGEYQTTKRGQRRRPNTTDPVQPKIEAPDINDDESIL